MTRVPFLALAAFIAASPAFADGGGGKLTGLGDFGYDYVDFDNGNANVFHGTGSVLWAMPDKWNIQGNFDTSVFNGDLNGLTNTKFGVGAFWRDQSQGLLGGELRYQTFNGLDGFDLRARGELFLTQFTIGASLGYGEYDDIDGWNLNAYGTYYVDQRLGLNLTTKYGTWDGAGLTTDFDEFALDGEVEYLCPEYDTSVYAGLGFGTLDADTGPDNDYWHIGLGLRFHLGNNGSLQQRNRAEPLRTVRDHFVF